MLPYEPGLEGVAHGVPQRVPALSLELVVAHHLRHEAARLLLHLHTIDDTKRNQHSPLLID